MKNKAFLLVFLLSLVASLSGLTLHSSAAGGNWTDPNSWVEHVVPDSTMDVEINSLINVVGSSFCRSAKVNPSGTLRNSGMSFTVTIYGDLVNYGTVTSYSSSLLINLRGNLSFWDGAFTPYRVTFLGEANQTISQADSVSFNCTFYNSKPSGDLCLGTDIILNGYTMHLNQHTLLLAGYRITNTVLTNGIVYGGGNSLIDTATLSTVTFNDSIKVYGNVAIADDSVVFNDLVTVYGILRNSGMSFTVTIYGDLVNYGTVTSYSSSLLINLRGNLSFWDGAFTPNRVTFLGEANQTISQADSVSFNCTFYNSKPSGDLCLGTDIILNGYTMHLNQHTLLLAGYRITNTVLTNGIVYGGGNSVIDTATLSSVTFNDSIKVYGNVAIADDHVVFNDLVTVYGILRNSGTTFTVTFYGDLVNYGTVTSYSSSLLINLMGNLLFWDGAFTPNRVTFLGESNQTISQADSVSFNCTFYNSKPSGDLCLGTDIILNGYTMYLNQQTLLLAGYRITNTVLTNGIVYGGGNSLIDTATLSSVTLLDCIQLYGLVNIADNSVVFNDLVTVYGILRNSGMTFTVTIYGDLVNYGTVTSYSSSLLINLRGNLSFWDGAFTPNRVTFLGEANQTISQADSVSFNCTFYNSKPSGDLCLGTDIILNGYTVHLNQHTLLLAGYRITNTVLTNGIVYGGGNSLIDTATLSSVTFNDSIKVYGNVAIADDHVVFNDLVTVYGILRNSGTTFTVTFYGDLVNYGTVTSYSSSLLINLRGNLSFWNGIFTPASLTFSGDANQFITQSDSVAFNCIFQITKSSGSVILGSDCWLSNRSFNIGTKNLSLSGYKMSNAELSNGTVMGGGNSTIEYSNLSSVAVYNSIQLNGVVGIADGAVVFNGLVTVNGTLQHKGIGSSYTLSINGDIVNYGTMKSNSYSLYIDIHGNLINHGIVSIARLFLFGIGQHTINLAASPNATFSISTVEVRSSNFEFCGTNIMPAFTIPVTSVCRIGENAILTLPNVDSNITGTYTNLGKISLHRSVNDTADKNFYKAIVKPNADYNTKVSSLKVETNCYTIPPYFQEGGLMAWWNLIPTTTSTNLSLNQLILSYDQDMLNTENESALELVHSYDCISWAKIGSITVDTVNNKVTIPNAPGRGYFAFTRTVQISGRVVGWDNPTLPLSGVKVSLGDEFTDTLTNASGNWVLNVPPYQSCSISFIHPNYNPQTQTVRVWTTNLNVGDITLQEKLGSPNSFVAVQNALGTITELSWGISTRFEDDLNLTTSSGERVFTNYSVYRLLYGEENNRSAWTLLASQTGVNFTDTAWANVAFGVYRYALIANYSSGLSSLPVFSDQVKRRDFSVSESFDSLTMPSGWSVQHSGTTTSTWAPTLDNGSDYSLMVMNTPPNSASERLLSATYNCTRYTKVFVSFWHNYLPNTNSQAVLQVTTNGVQWSMVNNFAAVADSGYKSFDISTYAANMANVRFRWTYTATSSATNYWKVDDFRIYGYTPIPVYLADPYPAPSANNCNNHSVNLGIKVIDDDMVNSASLQYRIDANGNGIYDANEVWNQISGYQDAQILEIRVIASFETDGSNLRYEFKADDLANNGIRYSGSAHQMGIADDFGINIKSTPPPQISGLHATSITNTAATINWISISDPQFSHYELYLSKNETVDLFDVCLLPLDFPVLANATTNTLEITELEPDRFYWLAIRAVDTFGNVSLLSVTSLLTPISFPPSISNAIPHNQPDPGWVTDRTVSIGCVINDFYGVNTNTISYRIDANGNGAYDIDEGWQMVPPESIVRDSEPAKNGKLSVCAAEASITRERLAAAHVSLPVSYNSDGDNLHFEFRADDINGFTGYSGLNNALGINDDWKVKIDTIAPTAIGNLSFVCIADSAVELSWNASQDQYFKTYQVFYGTHDFISLADSLWDKVNDPILGESGSGYVTSQITGLVPHNLYRFRVRAIDHAGNCTYLSNEVRAYFGEMLNPEKPMDIAISCSGQDIILNWTPVETDVEGNPLTVDWFNIYVGFTPDFPADDEHFLDSCLSNSYTHYEMLSYDLDRVFYKVTAEYGLGISTRRQGGIVPLGQENIMSIWKRDTATARKE